MGVPAAVLWPSPARVLLCAARCQGQGCEQRSGTCLVVGEAPARPCLSLPFPEYRPLPSSSPPSGAHNFPASPCSVYSKSIFICVNYKPSSPTLFGPASISRRQAAGSRVMRGDEGWGWGLRCPGCPRLHPETRGRGASSRVGRARFPRAGRLAWGRGCPFYPGFPPGARCGAWGSEAAEGRRARAAARGGRGLAPPRGRAVPRAPPGGSAAAAGRLSLIHI